MGKTKGSGGHFLAGVLADRGGIEPTTKLVGKLTAKTVAIRVITGAKVFALQGHGRSWSYHYWLTSKKSINIGGLAALCPLYRVPPVCGPAVSNGKERGRKIIEEFSLKARFRPPRWGCVRPHVGAEKVLLFGLKVTVVVEPLMRRGGRGTSAAFVPATGCVD
jgi:hypothetical protein